MFTWLDVQRALKARGFNPGPLDGELGRKTIAAVAAFQAAEKLHIKYPGTVGPKTLAALGLSQPAGSSPAIVLPPPWYAEARRRIGLHEVANNKTLSEYLKSAGGTVGDPAKIPWCGDFVETVIAKTLPGEPLPSNPYWALNWAKFGVALARPALGAILSFKRDGGGHVGFLAGHDATYFHVLGGNQSNAVTIAKIAKSRLAGMRWPASYEKPTAALPPSTLNATISTNEA